jgi:antitoxin component YwqK of YwqJK toxin-antitoxin module
MFLLKVVQLMKKRHITKMRQPGLLLIFPIFVLLGCHQDSDKGKDIRKQFYNTEGLSVKRTFYEEEGKEATILTERTFKNDSIPHGYARSYFKNGQLKGEDHYQNGVKHGVSKSLYKNGQLSEISCMKHGVLDSLGIMYYTDGQIKIKSFWYNGEQVGEQLYYYPNGSLEKYLMYDPVGKAVYGRKYNEQGEFLQQEGVKNARIVYKGEDDIFTTGEILNIKIYAPTPPDCKVRLFVSIKDENGQALLDKKPVSIENGLATYEMVLNEVGKYYFETTISFEDKSIDEQQEYSNAFEYSVIKLRE